jgi:hypothetical protein
LLLGSQFALPSGLLLIANSFWPSADLMQPNDLYLGSDFVNYWRAAGAAVPARHPLPGRPLIAGALMAFITIKPQLGLLLPLLLLLLPLWRAFAAAVVTIALVVLGLLAFGAEPWRISTRSPLITCAAIRLAALIWGLCFGEASCTEVALIASAWTLPFA